MEAGQIVNRMHRSEAKRRHDYHKEARLRDLVAAEPGRASAYSRLAAWLVRSGRSEQARDVLRRGLVAVDRPADLEHLLGLILFSGGAWEPGLRHLERAAGLEPARFTFVRDLALAQSAAGRTAAAVETLRTAVRLAGREGRRLVWLLRLAERAVRESGGRPVRRPPMPSREEAAVERMVARDPEVAAALIPRKGAPGTPRREILRAARRALARLLAERPGQADLYFGLGLVAEALGEVDRAIEAAEQAIALNPSYVEACLLAVRVYRKAGRAERAEDRARAAANLRPGWADVHLSLGNILGEQGRAQEAAVAYRRALDLGADSDEARRGVEAVAVGGRTEGGRA